MKAPVGVIHGRFQMLHKGHMEYLLAGKERCEHLIIGISNPDVSVIRYSEANPHRSDARANPLTYLERLQMIRGAMLEYGVKDEEFDIVPFPINCPELLDSYVPRDAVFFMTLYDQWSLDKKAELERLGYKIEVMWERNDSDKFTVAPRCASALSPVRTGRILFPTLSTAICRNIGSTNVSVRNGVQPNKKMPQSKGLIVISNYFVAEERRDLECHAVLLFFVVLS